MGVSVLLILSLGTAISGQGQDLRELVPASAQTIVRTPQGTMAVQFTLENHTNKDITAWGVDLRCSRADGTIITRSYMAETFESYEHLLPAETRSRTVLLSQGVLTPVIPLGSETYTDVSVSVRFVVFADRTSFGDSRAIDEVFHERDRISKAYTVILAALRAGQAAGSNREGLSVALQYLNSPNNQDQGDYDHKNGLRRSLRAALEKAPDEVTAGQFLEYWVDRAQRIITAANKHKR